MENVKERTETVHLFRFASRDSTMASKRPNSDPQQKSKRLKLWGREKRDLVTVHITCSDDSTHPRKFKTLWFRNQPEVCITLVYKGCCLKEHLDDVVGMEHGVGGMEDIIRKVLSSLKEEIKPMGNMIQAMPGDRHTWDISEDDFVTHGLCHSLMRAFLYNMEETSGKDAIASLLKDIIKPLGLGEKLSTVSTGSPSNVSFCATSIKLTANSDESAAAKLSTTDLLVFYTPEELTVPIETCLVVIIKKKDISAEEELQEQLLSRLPYQSGMIFGMYINAMEAVLYSVTRQHDRVDIYRYKDYIFRKPKETFCVDSFWNMIVDIGLLMASISLEPQLPVN
ncbi:hypothetical protein FSP39_008758 [Pinctada imbricata]|uniref:Uncharacterized protein n=1 Tax=Pinctada imbricata TaxID=66713 RepID=A0AA88Y8N1_PINIB|nr:hypothetical protein FSP39_008758 [Pinctada imbricata]